MEHDVSRCPDEMVPLSEDRSNLYSRQRSKKIERTL